ncbi:MAG: DUF4197 domain-containing protein [Pseudomonadales bacterium]
MRTTPRGPAAATGRWLLAMLPLVLMASAPALGASWLDRLKDAIGGETTTSALSTGDIAAGLKEALTVGTDNVVAQLGASGGFNLDPQIHIPLPGQLEKAKDLLARVGMDGALSDLEERLNRAAEEATPKARALFVDAISAMTLDDVMGIYNGPDDAATQYFRTKMSAPLTEEMTPLVQRSLADVGAVATYDTLMERYRNIPFAPEVDADLNGYVVDKGIDGIFFYLAREEAAIRANPAKRTTELLKKVFGR